MPKSDHENEYLIEFVVLGNAVKVTAIDPNTMKEVSIVGAKGVSKDVLSNLAIRKLRYVMRRKKDKP